MTRFLSHPRPRRQMLDVPLTRVRLWASHLLLASSFQNGRGSTRSRTEAATVTMSSSVEKRWRNWEKRRWRTESEGWTMTKARNQWWNLYVFSCVCNNKELSVVVVSSFLGKVARRCRISLRVSSRCQLPVANLAACRLFRTRSGKERLGNMGFMYEQFVDSNKCSLEDETTHKCSSDYVASVWTKHCCSLAMFCNMQQQEALESCCFDEDAAQRERLSAIFESVFQRNITEIIAE